MDLKISPEWKRDILRMQADVARGKVMRKSMANIARDARKKAPVITGNLRRSFDIEITNNGEKGVIHNYAEYSGYVELGTRFKHARPFLKPAFEKEIPRFLDDMGRIARLEDV